MNNTLPLSHENSLPAQAKTRGGVIFYPRQEVWSYTDSLQTVRLDFTTLPVTDVLRNSIKTVLLWYAENLSPGYLVGRFHLLSKFLWFFYSPSFGPVTCITPEQIISYRGSLDKQNEHFLGSLVSLFKQWHDMRLVGISTPVISLLKKMSFKGCEKGQNILTWHIHRGPLTDLEFESVHDALDTALKSNRITLHDYLLAWMVISLGQRPIQYAALKLKDFHIYSDDESRKTYTLDIPRAKQRNQNRRDSFKERTITPIIGDKLAQHVEKTRLKFVTLLTDPNDAPMFPVSPLNPGTDVKFLYHMGQNVFGQWFQKIMDRLNIISERTGKQIHLSARRFRYTYGTRMAAEGYHERVIAENLDHSTTQNVWVYTAALPAIIERVDRVMAIRLAPLVRAFRGEIIKNESKAARTFDPASRVCDPRFGANNPVGSCAASGSCRRFAPLGCYTCRHFQPWCDGPHDKLLQHLLDERERLVAEHDARIASVRDRTIFAIAEVVKKCEQIRKAK